MAGIQATTRGGGTRQIRAVPGSGPRSWSSDAEALAKRVHCYPPALLQQAWDYLVRRLSAA
jgi:hypothetical protein